MLSGAAVVEGSTATVARRDHVDEQSRSQHGRLYALTFSTANPSLKGASNSRQPRAAPRENALEIHTSACSDASARREQRVNRLREVVLRVLELILCSCTISPVRPPAVVRHLYANNHKVLEETKWSRLRKQLNNCKYEQLASRYAENWNKRGH